MSHPEMFSEGQLHREIAVPLHEQISGRIRQRISSGEWPAHHRLLSEPELSEQFGVSRGTLRRALLTLIREGALVQVRGRGTFVTPAVLEPGLTQRLVSLSEDFARQGVEFRTSVLQCSRVTAPRQLQSTLDIAAGAKVVLLRRVRSTDQGPVAYLHNVVREDLAPGLARHDFTSKALFAVLEADYGLSITSGRRTFDAVTATEDVAGHLDVDPGAPLQHIEQVTLLADGRPIEYSDVWIRSDRMRLTSFLSRR